jgi:SAM-dependent methyltransferase
MHDNKSYQGPRRDLLSELKVARRVLDVGCNNGSLARGIKVNFPEAQVWGIEINESALAKALPALEQGWGMDLDDLDLLRTNLRGLEFDHIVAGDVLEHTVNYKEITGILYEHLSPEGRLIISVPNYGHWHTLYVFFTQKWQRNDRGIFDKTHRTIIMKGNLKEFLTNCPGGRFKLLKRNFRFFETRRLWKINMIITYLLFPLLIIPHVRNMVTHGFVFSIQKP